jgi:hypothetical protein
MKKYCSFHERKHNIEEFSKNKANKDGFANICKVGKRLYNKGVTKNGHVSKKLTSKVTKDYLHYSSWWGAHYIRPGQGSYDPGIPDNKDNIYTTYY